jgi:hypothetical protein
MPLSVRIGIAVCYLLAGRLVHAESRFGAVHIVPGKNADEIEQRYVHLLRERIAEITTAPVTVGPLTEKFTGLVVHIGTPQSHPELAGLAETLAIPLPSEFDPGAEGFVLASRPAATANDPKTSSAVVLAIGADRRGVLYAVGEILRQIIGRGDAVSFPADLHLRRAPRWAVRGLIVSQGDTIRDLTGSRRWTQEELQRAHLDYALAGANTFEVGAGDRGLFAFLKSYGLDALTVITANAGSGPAAWQAKEAIGRLGNLSPGIPEARAALLKQKEALFKSMPEFDYVHFKSGDAGGDESEVSAPFGRALIYLCEDDSRTLRKYHPRTKIFVGNQKLDNAGERAIFEYLQAAPRDWIDGICYGPGSNAMGWTPGRRQDHRTDLFHYARRGALGGYLREMLHQLPPRQSILLFTDLTHWVYSQYGLMDHAMIPDRNHQTPPKWDYWMYERKPCEEMARVYNRRTFHARPRNYYHVFQETAEFAIGDVAYSEGHHDHLNQWIYQRLFWDPHQTVESVVSEYARAHFGPAAAASMAEAIFKLETNLQTPIRGNTGIDRLVELVEKAGKEMPDADRKRNYLWREYFQRAYLDKYIQLDVLLQDERMAEVLAQLRSAFEGGNLDDVVLKLRDTRLPKPSSEMLRLKSEAERIGEESDRLFGVRNEGLFNLKQDYIGFGWVTREINRAADAPSTAQRREIVERILYFDDPGEGGFYDIAGDPEQAPHLVYGWPYGDAAVSSKNRPSQRKMAFTTDEERGVTFRYDHLDPAAQYRVRFTLVRPRYAPRYAVRQKQTSESIYADDIVLAENLKLPESVADFFEYDIPRSATSDGQLVLTFKKQPGVGEGLKSDVTIWRNTGGWGTLVSEVWLMKKGAPKRYQAALKTRTR